MKCPYSNICGGCTFLELEEKEYQTQKVSEFKKIISQCSQKEIAFANPIFIPEGTRRRASLAFTYAKKKLILGFNEKASKNLVDVEYCPQLTEKLNQTLPAVRELLSELCQTPITERIKKGKIKTSFISQGDISICEADNGIDIVLEFSENLELQHKLIISEISQKYADIIRLSHRKSAFGQCETLAEKAKPFIKIADINVYISAGTFLQASKQGETALLDTANKYLGSDSGRIADLFCGIGTFSYPLSLNKNNKITAIDSSAELLEGFKTSINKNMISNIEILQKNLFKYPLDEAELKNIDIIFLDPPRAGALEQARKISETGSIRKVIYVSCNPNSFVRDADVLIAGGYKIDEITFVDQFTFSTHFESVAVFTKIN
ncbi:MAG: methyltransferase [Alphaproteobacteria bacterium]|nr:methyltransferase [Alphaproteobacteria bacterium]